MASGLTGPLAVLTCVQVAVGLPLLLPFEAIRGPTISLYHALHKGPGGYVGGTVVATIAVLLGSSIWEAVSLGKRDHESSHQAMISAVSLARAHLAVVMCFVNISLAMAFSKLSFEMKTHGQLRKSHAALQKQAAGISQEYTRMSSTIPAPKASADTDSPTSNAELAKAKDELAEALVGQATAQQELEHIRMQYKSLEASYDALMAENMKSSSDQEPRDSLQFSQHRKAD